MVPTPPDVPEPPRDPRLDWTLPPPGTLPSVEHLDEAVTRVLAPNASPMTLDGTNTYVVGAPGAAGVAVVDPGPADPGHLDRVLAEVGRRDAEVAAVLVTHHHHDHSEAAAAWAARFGCRVHAGRRDIAGPDGVLLGDGDLIDLPDIEVVAVATPGHAGDHVVFRIATGTLLTGDHVLGRGTSVVSHPDGDLAAYLASLRKVLDLGPHALYPGHGPALTDDVDAVVRFYLDHRGHRTAQVLAELALGPATPAELVARIYHDVARHLWPPAERSTRALLVMLARDGVVVHTDDDVVRLAG